MGYRETPHLAFYVGDNLYPQRAGDCCHAWNKGENPCSSGVVVKTYKNGVPTIERSFPVRFGTFLQGDENIQYMNDN